MKYIDNPIIILISIIVGIIVGFRNIYVMVMSMYSKDKEKEDAEYEYYKDMEEERKKRFTYRISSDTAPPRYPNKLDYLILDEKDKPIDKKH